MMCQNSHYNAWWRARECAKTATNPSVFPPAQQLQDVADSVASAAVHRSSSQQMRAHLYGALVHMQPVAISERYVAPLLEALGRDAVSATPTCNCTAYALLADLVQRDTRQRMQLLEHKGYLSHMMGDISREDQAVAEALASDAPDASAAVYVFEARLCFLLAAAKTLDGARCLLLCGMLL